MKSKIRLRESQLKSVIRLRLTELGGQRGRWKPEWDKEDQMLAMYNALYGIEEFGMSKNDVAEKIIGTSLDSFVQQTSNFDFQHTGQGLDRPHDLQSEVYKEFKDVPKEKFKEICQQIIDNRLENPPEAATKKQVGGEIGDKRDQIDLERMDALRKKGITDPSRFKLISSVPSEIPNPEEDYSSDTSVPTSKEEVKVFLDNLLNHLKNAQSKEDIRNLAGDIEFITDYIDSEWVDVEDEKIVAEAKSIYYKKSFSDLNRILQLTNNKKRD